MTCIGISKLNGLMWIPLALARMTKLYCLATMALQKVGKIIDGSSFLSAKNFRPCIR